MGMFRLIQIILRSFFLILAINIGLTLLSGFHQNADAATYYVDSSAYNRTCTECQNPSTPTNTVNDVIDNCSLSAGDIVKIRGTFTGAFTVNGTVDGSWIHPSGYPNGLDTPIPEPLDSLSGSIVSFSTTPSGVSTTTDYVLIYNSRKGNSGAFKVSSVSGDEITVDTSRLPGAAFLAETSSDPGDLRGCIIRPVSFEAWDSENIPTWNYSGKTIFIGTRYASANWDNNDRANYIRYCNLKLDGQDNTGWGAICIYQGDYNIFDTIEMTRYAGGISTEPDNGDNPLESSTVSSVTETSIDVSGTPWTKDEHAGHIVYMTSGSASGNKYVIDSNDSNTLNFTSQNTLVTDGVSNGDGFGVYACHRANYGIIQFSNLHDNFSDMGASSEIIYVGSTGREGASYDYWQFMYSYFSQGDSSWSDGQQGEGIDLNKQNSNYATVWGNEFENMTNSGSSNPVIGLGGTGHIVANNYVHDTDSIHPEGFQFIYCTASNSLIFNNIVDTIVDGSYGIEVFGDYNKIFNNVFYNMPGAIAVRNNDWASPNTGNEFRNNIAHTVYQGFCDDGSMTWGKNCCYNCTVSGEEEFTADPEFTDPANADFSLNSSSPCIDIGLNLSSVFNVDFHDAAYPTISSIMKPVFRAIDWDIGAYEYLEGDPTSPPSPPSGLKIVSASQSQ